jgi:argininosuccinate lyase
VHTGRSRNDQVLVAVRLWERAQLARLEALCLEVSARCLARARATAGVPMPGYTHLQRAVPSTLGAFFAAFAEAFLDDAESARAAYARLDANPLGTAAGYGVNLPLDRAGTTTELGFSRVLVSPIYAQNSRGKLELYALGALEQALLDVRRLAWDLSLFTMAELGFATLPTAYTTGSSIMPNKRNPDVVELLRALPGVVEGARAELGATLSLPSGYHRDLQATKGPVLRAFGRGLEGLALVPTLIDEVRFDEARMRAAPLARHVRDGPRRGARRRGAALPRRLQAGGTRARPARRPVARAEPAGARVPRWHGEPWSRAPRGAPDGSAWREASDSLRRSAPVGRAGRRPGR